MRIERLHPLAQRPRKSSACLKTKPSLFSPAADKDDEGRLEPKLEEVEGEGGGGVVVCASRRRLKRGARGTVVGGREGRGIEESPPPPPPPPERSEAAAAAATPAGVPYRSERNRRGVAASGDKDHKVAAPAVRRS